MENKFKIVKFDEKVEIKNNNKKFFGKVKPQYKTVKKYAFKNLETGKIGDERFDSISTNLLGDEIIFCGDWVPVKIDNFETFFNPNTHTFRNQKFAEISTYGLHEYGLCTVSFAEDKDRYERLYDVEEDYIFKSEIVCPDIAREKFSEYILEVLNDCPEDFVHLPTPCFRDKKLINKYLTAVAEQIKRKYPEKGSNEKIIQYAKNIQKLIAEKIAKEKENIKLLDESKKEFNEIMSSFDDLRSEL